MNMKKVLAGIAAAVLTVSLAGISADALKYVDERTPGKDYYVAVGPDKDITGWAKESGFAMTDVYGIRFYIKVNDPSQGYGGGIGINATSNNWESHEWGNADAGKEIVSDGTTVELLKDAPIFKADETYSNLFMQKWWGDFDVVKVELLGKDGAVIATDEDVVEAAPAAEEAPAPAAVEAAPAEEAAEEAEEEEEEDVDFEEEEEEEEEEDEDLGIEVNAIPMFASTDWSVSDMNANSIKITGDGTYTLDFAAAGSPDFGVFCIDFEMMNLNYPGAEATLDSIEVDGEEVEFDPDQIAYGDLEEKGNFRIDIYNQYSETKDTTGFDHTLPINESLSVTFTVSGLNDAARAAAEAEDEEDIDIEEVDVEEEEPAEEVAVEEVAVEEAPAAEEAPAEEAPAPAAETTSTTTGNVGIGVIASVMALAAAGAFVSRRKK